MMHTKFAAKCLMLIFVISTSFLNVVAQEESSEEIENTIEIDEISEETEKVTQRIFELKKILIPNPTISSVDTLLNNAYNEITIKRDNLYNDIKDETKRSLKAKKVTWSDYKKLLKSYQKILNDRDEELGNINKELISELDRWQKAKAVFSNNENIDDSLIDVIEELEQTLSKATVRLSTIFIIKKRLTELILITDAAISEIDSANIQLNKEYFIFDSKPIWKLKKEVVKDSLLKTSKVNMTVTESVSQIKEFYKFNIRTAIVQFGFIVLLLILLIIVRKKWSVKMNQLSNPLEIQSKIVLSNYIISTITVGFLISAFFYDALIPIVVEFHILIVLSGTVYLLPKLTNQKFTKVLVLILVVFIAHLIDSYINLSVINYRLLLLFESIIVFAALYLGINSIRKYRNDFIRISKLFLFIAPFYIFLTVISIIANCIGMVSLSYFVINAVLSSTILMMLIYLGVKVVTSIVVLLFKLRKTYGIEAVSTVVHATHKRIQPILFWFGMSVWLFYSLKNFDVLNLILQWVDTILALQWEIGEAVISFGGILAFISIFIITLLLSKLASNIFEDDWMQNTLPRGLAPAISLIIRILIVCVGFYISLSAAGLDLSKLGFIIGALGVGIGFGLQNIVLNFIAGLILAFERPINIGDAIEVDNEFGIVTNIGIRSSHIKTYGGYEAIIPNGDLISKKVVNWTLTNRDRRSKKFLKTAPNVDPNTMIDLFNSIASKHPKTFDDPAPITFFKGYEEEGNLLFELWYWSTFSETLGIDHDIALEIFAKLKEEGIQAPVPTRRIVKD